MLEQLKFLVGLARVKTHPEWLLNFWQVHRLNLSQADEGICGGGRDVGRLDGNGCQETISSACISPISRHFFFYIYIIFTQ